MELLQCIGLAIVGVFLSLGALTYNQRKAIKERDQYRCQHPDTTIRHGGKLQVDHITPQRFGQAVLKMTEEELDVPNNLLTECENHHVGHPRSRHPDLHQANCDYRDGDHQAYAKLMEERNRKVANGQIYHNNAMDGKLRKIAKERTAEMNKKKPGWFPRRQ